MNNANKSPSGQANRNDPYSTFTLQERRYFVALLGYLTLASSLTATIYFPVIELLSEEYDVSVQSINLTITFYVIFQAISPAIFAPLSDTFGRRPILLATFLAYTTASLGLALNKTNYVALLVLRGLQSLGGSAVLSLAYGIISDVITHGERGRMLGPLLAATNLGPCVGPLFGGLIALKTQGSAWCFWTLVIFGGVGFFLIGWTLPETARPIVGNGTVAARGIWRTWSAAACLVHQGQRPRMESRDDGSPHNNAEITGTSNAYPIRKLSMPHPLGALRIVFYKDTFLALWTAAVVYAVWYCIQTILPVTYGPIYQFNELEVGLSYLAGGTGVIAGGIIAGKLMDWNYRVIAGKHGLSINQSSGDDIRHFPIEEARSRGCYAIFALYLLEVVGLGWVIQYKVHCSVPLILQFLIGAHGTIIHQTFNALLVDIFPENASTAAAAGNITRCGLAAALVAAMQPLVSVIGHGFFFTLVGLLGSLSGILAIILLRLKGREWRRERNKGSPLDSTELVPESENKR